MPFCGLVSAPALFRKGEARDWPHRGTALPKKERVMRSFLSWSGELLNFEVSSGAADGLASLDSSFLDRSSVEVMRPGSDRLNKDCPSRDRSAVCRPTAGHPLLREKERGAPETAEHEDHDP